MIHNIYIMNSFKLFGFKRKLDVFSFVEDYFEFHSRATEGEKGKIRPKKNNFLANPKSLNEFNICLITLLFV